MKKFIIKNNAPMNTYDKVFKIIDQHSTFFRVDTENEYRTNEGYVLEFKSIPANAALKICELKNVEEL